MFMVAVSSGVRNVLCRTDFTGSGSASPPVLHGVAVPAYQELADLLCVGRIVNVLGGWKIGLV